MLSGVESSELEFRDLTPTTMPIKAEASRIEAKAVKKIFFLLLDKLMFLPESKIPAKKSLIRVMVDEMDWSQVKPSVVEVKMKITKTMTVELY